MGPMRGVTDSRLALLRAAPDVHNGPMSKRLAEEDVAEWIHSRPGWERVGDEIRKRFESRSFADAIAFVVRVGFLAEAADHHPDLDIRWRTVVVGLTTHDAGGLTDSDLAMAASIDAAAD
jgi:4a-hydroxytetrahydrobiopterin dehydratase